MGQDKPTWGRDCLLVEDVAVVGEEHDALRCRVAGKVVRVPRAQIMNTTLRHTGDRGPLVIPRWLARGLKIAGPR
jgi:hypothetical protein